MGNPLIAIADSPFPNLNPAAAVLSEVNAELVMADAPTPERTLAAASQADGLMVTYGRIAAEVIAGLDKCKVIAYDPDIDKSVVAALDAGQLAGAALDVMPVESPPKDLPPKDLPPIGRDNVIFSPHTAFYSVEALAELQAKAAQGVADVPKGEKPVYPVNPEILG